MKPPLRVTPLGKEDEKRFLDFLEKDRALHIFTIYDFNYLRERTKVWLAFRNDEVSGYLFEFDKRIVHTQGDEESVAQLLRFVDFDVPVFIIEPHHLGVVEKFFKPVEPTDPSSKCTITTYYVMEADDFAEVNSCYLLVFVVASFTQRFFIIVGRFIAVIDFVFNLFFTDGTLHTKNN